MSLIPAGKAISEAASEANVNLVKVTNGEPEVLVRSAVDALGGMKRFIDEGDRVVVKPNIGWDRNPAQGANTHPGVVAEVVRLCLQAGAKEVQVFDYSCNAANRCYKNSGIQEAASKAGAKVTYVMEKFFREVKIEDGYILKEWPFYKPALEADKYINLPVLKHHGMAELTIGMKNIMGVIGGKRSQIHHDYVQKIVDLNTVIKPALIVVDATRIMRRNGPTGGSLADVEQMRTVIAGVDPVAVDGAAALLFGYPLERLASLALAEQKGLGTVRGIEKMAVVDLAG